MKRRVKWKSSYKGPGDDKSRYVKLGAAAAAVLAVLAAGSLMAVSYTHLFILQSMERIMILMWLLDPLVKIQWACRIR